MKEKPNFQPETTQNKLDHSVLEDQLNNQWIESFMQKNKEQTQQDLDILKTAFNTSRFEMIAKYVNKNNIELKKLQITNSNEGHLSLDWWRTFIKTSIENIDMNTLHSFIIKDFMWDYFINENGQSLKETLKTQIKAMNPQEVKDKVLLYNNDINAFRLDLINSFPNEKEYFNIITEKEIKELWILVQFESHKQWVTAIEQNKPIMESLLDNLDIEWMNGKSITQNWQEANGLLKTWAWIAGIYGLWKVAQKIWNWDFYKDKKGKKYSLSNNFWQILWIGLAWELIGQVYAWKSYTNEAVNAVWDMLTWESNIKELTRQHSALDKKQEQQNLSLITAFLLENRSWEEMMWDFDFVNKESQDPLIISLIKKSHEQWETVTALRKKLIEWRQQMIENTFKDLPPEYKLSNEDFFALEWDTFTAKRKTLLTKIQTLVWWQDPMTQQFSKWKIQTEIDKLSLQIKPNVSDILSIPTNIEKIKNALKNWWDIELDLPMTTKTITITDF